MQSVILPRYLPSEHPTRRLLETNQERREVNGLDPRVLGEGAAGGGVTSPPRQGRMGATPTWREDGTVGHVVWIVVSETGRELARFGSYRPAADTCKRIFGASIYSRIE